MGAQLFKQALNIDDLDRQGELISPLVDSRYTYTRWSGLAPDERRTLDLVHIRSRGSKVGTAVQLVFGNRRGAYTLARVARLYGQHLQELEPLEAALKEQVGNACWGMARLCWLGSDDLEGQSRSALVASCLSQQVGDRPGEDTTLEGQSLAYGPLWQLFPTRIREGWSQTDLVLVSENERQVAERINLELLYGYRFLLVETYRCWTAYYADRYQVRRPKLLAEIDVVNRVLPQVVGVVEQQPVQAGQGGGKEGESWELRLFQQVSQVAYLFAEHVSEIAELQNTLEINALNFWQHVGADWGLADAGTGALHDDYCYWRQVVEQIERDLRHYHEISSRLGMAMTQLQVGLQLKQGWLTASLLEVQHRGAEMEQRRSLILALIGLMLGFGEIFSSFLDVLPPGWQDPIRRGGLAISVILTLGLLGFLLSLLLQWLGSRKPEANALER